MAHPITYAVELGVFVISLAFAIRLWVTRTRRAQYPPGPKQKFLVGNLFDMPRSRQCLKYLEWGHQYGPIIYLNVAGRPIIVLNNYVTTKDLLDKRGQIYSDKPQLQMVGELMGFSHSTPLSRYGPEWRNHRKLMNKALMAGTVLRDYSALQEWKIRTYLYGLLQDPDRVIDGLTRTFGEAVTEIAYGVTEMDGKNFVSMAEELSKVLIQAMRTAYLVELLPALKMVPTWFPGAKFKRDAKIWRQMYFNTRNSTFNSVREKWANHDDLPASFVTRALDDITENDDREVQERAIKAAAFSFYRAGIDSTTATIKFFILAMMLHPEIQAKAQAEIDSVVGDRLPGILDQSKLPYMTAVALESMRWGDHATLVPHRLMEDDHYHGYLIPAGSTVIANIWAMSRDPSIYPDPDTFDPERFFSRNEMDPREIVFGFGRRACPGSHLAIQGFYITATSFLWSYRVRSHKEPTAVDRDVYKLFDFSMLHHPLPFECRIEPRSSLTELRLREALSSGRPI